MRQLLIAAGVLLGGACAAPQSQMGVVSQQELLDEAEAQRRFVIETSWEHEARVDRLLFPLARSSADLCGPKARAELGARVAVRDSWARDYRQAALALGVSDSVTVTHVTPGSPAAQVLQPGDRLLAIDGRPIGIRTTGLEQFWQTFRQVQGKTATPVSIVFARPADPKHGLVGGPVVVDSGTVSPELLCSGLAEIVRDDAINAFADGKLVYVTTGMLRFASDEELQVVLAHEIAHNSERHIEAKQRNAAWGALLGAVADIAMASQGINTGGAYTNQYAALGAMSFSQDFEREADYVGAYILARAGLPTERAASLWRRMAAESPGSIKFASSHPTNPERFVRLGHYHAEIAAKRIAGHGLLPNRKER